MAASSITVSMWQGLPRDRTRGTQHCSGRVLNFFTGTHFFRRHRPLIVSKKILLLLVGRRWRAHSIGAPSVLLVFFGGGGGRGVVCFFLLPSSLHFSSAYRVWIRGTRKGEGLGRAGKLLKALRNRSDELKLDRAHWIAVKSRKSWPSQSDT